MSLRLALLQLKITKDKTENLRTTENIISNVVNKHQPRVIILPECFNSPYGTEYFPRFAEKIPEGVTSQILSKCAKDHGVYIIGGSIPEKENNKIYNTCTIWNPSGNFIAKHRKVHLFDNIDVKGEIRFKESDTVAPGHELTIINIDGHKIGIGICHDIRFEEMARLYRNAGCEMLVYPSAFNMMTGHLHWELLQRSRANDNQLYVVTVSPARDESADYVCWGHSMIVDPWAKVMVSAKEGEEVIVQDIDFSLVKQAREQIPVFEQRRTDLYKTEKL